MQNPYWINYRNLRVNKKDRYMLGAGLSYKILDWLTLSGRVRIDNSTNKYTEKFYATTNTQLTEQSNNGLFGLEQSEDKQFYADALLDINKTWDNWSFHANIGASISDMRYDLFKNRGPIAADNIPNVFSLFTIETREGTVRMARADPVDICFSRGRIQGCILSHIDRQE